MEFVSVVIPVYNEEKYIRECIDSLLTQTYPKENMEIIFVDGMSKDKTVEIINEYSKAYPYIKVLENPKKIVPVAMNIGIKAAVGEYIVRLDAHADYPQDYVEKCVKYLVENEDWDNVGGFAETKGRGFMGSTIALMLSSKFGVGNSKFRTERKSDFVDTVPFGTYRKSLFEKIGYYDERLVRNQDNELNYRIRKNGGKIFLAEDIVFSYYCRDSIKGISKMAVQNGKWNIFTSKFCPGTMGIRHFIPLAFVASVIGLTIFSLIWSPFVYLLLAELLLYLLCDILFTLKLKPNFKQFFILLALFPIFHVCYGFGSISGLINVYILRRV